MRLPLGVTLVAVAVVIDVAEGLGGAAQYD
jgi:hypothetical protein